MGLPLQQCITFVLGRLGPHPAADLEPLALAPTRVRDAEDRSESQMAVGIGRMNGSTFKPRHSNSHTTRMPMTSNEGACFSTNDEFMVAFEI